MSQITMSSSTIPNLDQVVKSGDLEEVKNLYTATDSKLKPTLLTSIAERAARNAQTEILEWCFQSGLEVPRNALNNELYDQACISRSAAVFGVLLAHGLDLNSNHSEFVGDALSFAAYHGDVKLVRLLLEKGADSDQAWGYQEHEAGVWAVVGPNKSEEILRLMLQHGWTQKNSTAHIAAADHGNLEILKLLVEADNGADLECAEPWWPVPSESEGDRWGTALYRAALKGQEEAVTYLLEKGADPKFKDHKRRSCYWAAMEGGNEKVMKMLEEAGLETV
ncbi:ankyrin repeat-containing protein [Xylariaceae sp. AK1471]|nr:ankyrin repeat-containing protein [Xylariaceae sp. AK1471]